MILIAIFIKTWNVDVWWNICRINQLHIKSCLALLQYDHSEKFTFHGCFSCVLDASRSNAATK